MSAAAQNLPGMIGRHPSMLEVYRLVRRAASSELPVLIVGETGTGKELVARALHDLGEFRDGPFVDLNCAAVPESLAEAELFGWERGAFTGAVRQTQGLLQTAHGGTLFLDEACSLSQGLQTKLLRVIELQDFRRVGGRKRLHSRFRLVTAVTTPLEELVARGALRDDFAYRIAGITVTLPPLRTRGRDVRCLAQYFLQAAARDGRSPKRLEPDALELLARHRWPGNVRELQTLMERLELFAEGPTVSAAAVLAHLPVNSANRHERATLTMALEAHGWDVRQTARALGIARSTLYRWLKQHGLERPVPTSSPVSRETEGASHATRAPSPAAP